MDPIILKQGHLPPDPSDTEMKDLFLMLSNLQDHGTSNIELIANELLSTSDKAQVKTLDALFNQADEDHNQKIEMAEWASFIKLVEGPAKNKSETEKHWKNTKSKFDADFDGALSRAEVALYLANTHVRAFYFVRRDQILQE